MTRSPSPSASARDGRRPRTVVRWNTSASPRCADRDDDLRAIVEILGGTVSQLGPTPGCALATATAIGAPGCDTRAGEIAFVVMSAGYGTGPPSEQTTHATAPREATCPATTSW
jgi:hypothetical protein